MTEAEWNSWQSTWIGATGPLPDVRARARREVRLHWLANAAFFALLAVALSTLFPVFSHPSSAVHMIGWVIIAFSAVMSIGYVAIQRGIGVRQTGNPRDALAFLERRLRVERLVAHLVRWSYAGLCVAMIFVFPPMVAGHRSRDVEMAFAFTATAVLFAVTFSAPWWVARRNRRHVEEIARWRRWMDEQQI